MKIFNDDNNETRCIGIVKNTDGTFTALTLARCAEFKTEAGAIRWLARRGYDRNGNIIPRT